MNDKEGTNFAIFKVLDCIFEYGEVIHKHRKQESTMYIVSGAWMSHQHAEVLV
jgi:hypothetical protein